MEKYLLITLLAVAALLTGCNKQTNWDAAAESFVISLSVTDIADNRATVTASLTEGEFHGARIVEAVRSDAVSVDYSRESILMEYVDANGVDVEFPYTNTITGLKDGVEMVTAVIVYNSKGEPAASSYRVWIAAGEPEIWSGSNDAGHAGEIVWPEAETGIELIDGSNAGEAGEIVWGE